jgi:hypothetical protein
MTSEQGELLELERRFWLAGEEWYREHLAPTALMVFAEPVGVLDREHTIAAIGAAARWSEVVLEDVRLLPVAAGVRLLCYLATARREAGGEPYVARASSVYVAEGQQWQLAFHQQSTS